MNALVYAQAKSIRAQLDNAGVHYTEQVGSENQTFSGTNGNGDGFVIGVNPNGANVTVTPRRKRVETYPNARILDGIQRVIGLCGRTVASMSVPKQATHIMGPEGEIIGTMYPYNDGKGFVIEFDYENVEVKANGNDIDGLIENLTVNLLETPPKPV